MTSHNDAIDQRDLAHLLAVRDLYSHVDPMPSDLIDRLKFEITVHALHAEVAELMDEALVATRTPETSPPTPTPTESVTFTSTSVSLMVSVSASTDPERVRIDGWVTRPRAQVDVVQGGGRRTLATDENGRFVVEGLRRGPTHFVIRPEPDNPDARPVITPTVEL